MIPSPERRRQYAECRAQLASLLEGETDLVARMSSAAALLMEVLPRASFVGFYRLLSGGILVAGPYQGPAACLRIRLGQGVCGTAASENRSLLVPDVEAFPGHIACDPRSRSELVVPVRDRSGAVIAVLDLDSRERAAFDECDQEELESIVRLIPAAERD